MADTKPILISLTDNPELANCQAGETLEVTDNDGQNLTVEKVGYPDEGEAGADQDESMMEGDMPMKGPMMGRGASSAVPRQVLDRGLSMVGKKSRY